VKGSASLKTRPDAGTEIAMPYPIDWPPALPYAVALAIGYLLGSIPFGLILTRCAGTPDLRSIGSGNIGATNVLRTGGKALAAATLIGDALKGTAAVLAARYAFGPDAVLTAAAGALLGHIFPVWLGFKGGKGVATYIGLLIGLAWSAAVIFCLVWLAVAALTRYSSLAALAASAATPVVLWFIGDPRTAILFVLLTILLWIMHRPNIVRLLDGTESKIGRSAPAAKP
jgi:glycerol-3-phosphate acyltransferase PlsY